MSDPLRDKIAAALYGTNLDHVEIRKEAMRDVLRRAIELVDTGRLACIILTELEGAKGSRVRMTPIGDPTMLLQTATQLVRQAKGALPDESQARTSGDGPEREG